MDAISRRTPSGAVMALAALALAIWPELGQPVLAVVVALAVHAALRPRGRALALTLSAALAWACVLALGWHFASDRFEVRYVWLYSSAELPLHLKLANLWGGDEGTTLLLAALCISLAAGGALRARVGPNLSPTAAIAAWLVLTALWLAPFAETPPEWLVQSASQGMNAHLMKPWMLFHAPLVLAAYAWTLALAEPALEALCGRPAPWPMLARTRARRAWVVLTAGIGFGMLWAFEDAMYGQVWHWDPVQTAVFCTWCLLGAHLHGFGGWAVGRRRWQVMPWAAVLAAVTIPLAMAVTRNPLLASSHRYVGADSWVSHVVLASILLLAAVGAGIAGRRVRADRLPATDRGTQRLGMWLVQICFLGAAAIAAAQLLLAFGATALDLPRAEHHKPFLAMLANLTTGAELAALRAAFEQWDVDGHAVGRALSLPLVAVGLIGGWYFCRRASARVAAVSLPLAVAVVAGNAVSGGLLTGGYQGTGVLSQQIVAVLPFLDAGLASGAYFALGCGAWLLASLRRQGVRGVSAALPVVAIHAGLVLALWGGLLATALNSYTQHEIVFAGEPTEWVRDRHGFALRLTGLDMAPLRDGGVGTTGGVHALTRIELREPGGALVDGQTLYRDSRAPPERYDGPLRQVCELLDYRYARHTATPGYLLQPLVDQGLWRTTQFWIAPGAVVESLAAGGSGGEVIVVVKTFPFLSLLWGGLLIMLAGSAWLAFRTPGTDGPTPQARPG